MFIRLRSPLQQQADGEGGYSRPQPCERVIDLPQSRADQYDASDLEPRGRRNGRRILAKPLTPRAESPFHSSNTLNHGQCTGAVRVLSDETAPTRGNPRQTRRPPRE